MFQWQVSQGVPQGRNPGSSGPGLGRETLEQIAQDFGVHPVTLSKWLRQADIKDGIKPGVTNNQAAELRAARNRIRRPEQENTRCFAGRRPTCRTFREEALPAREGYRFLFDEVADAGHVVSERTVWRICSANGWWSVAGKKKRGKKTKVGAPAHEDLVRRDFTATDPDLLWHTDLTEHRTNEGKLYVCAITDVWSNRIVDHSIADRKKSKIAVDALNNAVARQAVDSQKVADCTLHSDRGSQFRAGKRQHELWRHQLRGSMGQVGSADDNAAMQSFFALLQRNVFNRKQWTTRDELRIAIVTWIERIYHRRRRQDRLERLTPIEFELIMSNAADQAA